MKAHQKWNLFSGVFGMSVAIACVIFEHYQFALINLAFSVTSFFLARD